MTNKELNRKVSNAAKWSTVTEIASKFVTPVTTMILARLLAPDAFGVVATVTMIVSFADMLTNAGFQKYLVQHEFVDARHKTQSTNVAFWSNLVMSLILWAIIIFFNDPLARMVGNPGLGFVLVIAAIQLPITSFSSIQMALYRRDFDFKTLFLIRIIGICVPFVVTIPLALLGWSYWSLIIGSISGQVMNALILTVKSSWKPSFTYSFDLLQEMFSYSSWSLIEAISIWFTGWIDIFIIGSYLSTYNLGLYRTSLTTVNGILGIVTAATTPVLFSALSRLQHDDTAFNVMFFRIQKIVAYFIFPMGAGLYLYSDLATKLLLGKQWAEASGVIGIWAVTSAIMIVLAQFSSETYRAKGYPRLSFWAQILHLIVLVPTCIFSVRYGFWVLVYARAMIRFQFIIVHMILMKYAIKFPVARIFPNIAKPTVFTLVMCVIGFGLQQISKSVAWSFTSIGICILFYFAMLQLFARDDATIVTSTILNKRKFD